MRVWLCAIGKAVPDATTGQKDEHRTEERDQNLHIPKAYTVPLPTQVNIVDNGEGLLS